MESHGFRLHLIPLRVGGVLHHGAEEVLQCSKALGRSHDW